LKSANLGDDADTTAAICGQVAGSYYGLNGIPTDFLRKLAMHDRIIQLSKALMKGNLD